jgi:hypothetical protein
MPACCVPCVATSALVPTVRRATWAVALAGTSVKPAAVAARTRPRRNRGATVMTCAVTTLSVASTRSMLRRRAGQRQGSTYPFLSQRSRSSRWRHVAVAHPARTRGPGQLRLRRGRSTRRPPPPGRRPRAAGNGGPVRELRRARGRAARPRAERPEAGDRVAGDRLRRAGLAADGARLALGGLRRGGRPRAKGDDPLFALLPKVWLHSDPDSGARRRGRRPASTARDSSDWVAGDGACWTRPQCGQFYPAEVGQLRSR